MKKLTSIATTLLLTATLSAQMPMPLHSKDGTNYISAKKTTSTKNAQANSAKRTVSYAKLPNFFDTEIKVEQEFTDDISIKNIFQSPYLEPVTGKGYWFQAEKDVSYNITATFTTESQIGFDEWVEIYLFRTGALWGNTRDILTGRYALDPQSPQTLTLELQYTHHGDDSPMRLAIGSEALNAYTITITIEEQEEPEDPFRTIEYTLINKDDDIVSGKLDQTLKINDTTEFSATGMRFDVGLGKTYEIVVTFTQDQPTLTQPGFMILTENFTVIDQLQGQPGSTTSRTLNYRFTPWGTYEHVRFLFYDWEGNELSFTLVVEEKENPITTTQKTIEVGGNPERGVLDKTIDFFPWGVPAEGFKFEAEANTRYQITTTFKANRPTLIAPLSLIFSEEFRRIFVNGNFVQGVSELTTSFTFISENEGTLLLLLMDQARNSPGLEYTITIEKIPMPLSYTEIDYSELDMGTTATGILVERTNSIYDHHKKITVGCGHSVTLQAGKTYEITARFSSEQALEFFPPAGFYLLTGDELVGDSTDVIAHIQNWDFFVPELTVSHVYTADKDGEIRILLVDDQKNYKIYTLSVKEITTTTLPELLNNTNKTVTWTSNIVNMQYTSSGITRSLVAADEDLNFGWSPYHYAEAYKINLQANDTVNILLSKDNSFSNLYVFKSDGAGGYTFETTANLFSADLLTEDNFDSYIKFKSSTGGEYYIVVTDRFESASGRYYLSVWGENATMPNNAFGNLTDIVSVSMNKNSFEILGSATSIEMLAVLTAFEITGKTGTGEEIVIPNSPAFWKISSDDILATFDFTIATAPVGYKFSDGLSPIVVNISFIKAGGAAAPTPTLSVRTQQVIRVTPMNALNNGQTVEFTISTTNSVSSTATWQDDVIFGGLEPATEYFIFARAKENNRYLAGVASQPLIVSTMPSSIREQILENPLRAWKSNGEIHVSGLTIGKILNVYSSTGRLVYRTTVTGNEISIPLKTSGLYIIQSDGYAVKIVY